ncbi:FxsA family protein [Arsenicitalea aurantiaca]|uniref:FxsA family protein n=1 Tax=Arsenicitalea aurantiaca TaxID=1783274 RepID=A0A433X7X1_9HYPH|nr:FxsA family protein [Arsenicitalea aurantiaca]RUT30152.1 FxsA family protein [Arsenicitalea aurantiaca]
MGRLFFLLFLLAPLIEITLFVVIGREIGVLATLLWVLASAVLGILIIRWKGFSLAGDIRATMGQGKLPARALADAMATFIAGILLLIPGFLSDAIALILLIGPLRTLIYGLLARRMTVTTTTTSAHYRYRSGPETPPQDPARLNDNTIDLDEDDWRKR